MVVGASASADDASWQPAPGQEGTASTEKAGWPLASWNLGMHLGIVLAAVTYSRSKLWNLLSVHLAGWLGVWLAGGFGSASTRVWSAPELAGDRHSLRFTVAREPGAVFPPCPGPSNRIPRDQQTCRQVGSIVGYLYLPVGNLKCRPAVLCCAVLWCGAVQRLQLYYSIPMRVLRTYRAVVRAMRSSNPPLFSLISTSVTGCCWPPVRSLGFTSQRLVTQEAVWQFFGRKETMKKLIIKKDVGSLAPPPICSRTKPKKEGNN
ncbi:hypothetical protein LX32DRAFT_164246 [Colletotrichum zoysiae]|uniref:Uncharacterized protein n=1 Tax=Colletotrichum zoysiae TaxID=1216348 RepID=A0AAD9H7Y7_9PEZI|nr:hypothetical protein LX32DRAFT_164246 [Colletotrichum zoysiae]